MLGAALFLLLAACLDREALVRTPLYALEAWLCCAALAVAPHPTSARAALKLAARALLFALPLAVALFVFFPRLAGSFWAIPRGNTAVTGLSDSMSPGGILALIANYEHRVSGEVQGARRPRRRSTGAGQCCTTSTGRRGGGRGGGPCAPGPRVPRHSRPLSRVARADPSPLVACARPAGARGGAARAADLRLPAARARSVNEPVTYEVVSYTHTGRRPARCGRASRGHRATPVRQPAHARAGAVAARACRRRRGVRARGARLPAHGGFVYSLTRSGWAPTRSMSFCFAPARVSAAITPRRS